MGDGITITFDAETQDAMSKVQDFFDKVNGKIDETKAKSDEQKEEGGIFGWLVDATQAEEFVTGLGATVAALFTVEKAWETLKEMVLQYVESVNEAINRADEMGRAAEAIGISLRTLNALKELGEQNRVPLEAMEQSLYLLNVRISEAARRGGDAAKVFRDWGIGIFQSNGALKDTESVLRAVMDQLKEMDPQRGAAMVRDLVGMRGPQGREILEVLRQGSGALGESNGVTQEAAENARQFDMELVKLRQSVEQLWNEVAAALLPALRDLVDWFKNVANSEQGHLVIGTALVGVFQFMAAAVLIVKQQIEDLGTVSELGFGILADGLNLVGNLMDDFERKVVNAIRALIDLATAQSKVAQIMAEAATGHVGDAWSHTKEMVAGLKKDITSLATDSNSAAAHIADFFTSAFQRASDAAKQLFSNDQSVAGALAKIFNLGSGSSVAGVPSVPGESPAGNKPAGLSDAARQLIEEVNKAFAEATESKVALLNEEEAKLKKKLDEEIPDQQKREEEKLKVSQIYAAKRLEVTSKEADEANNIALAKLKNQQSAITGNPDLTDVEKTKLLIPLMQQELALDQKQLDVLRQRSTDPRLNDEARLNAQKEYIALQGQQVALAQKLESAQASLTLSGQFSTALINLRNQFNTLNEIGNQFQSIFSNAFNSVSTNLSGVINKTETWSQALRNIAGSIISSVVQAIVKIGTTWVAQQLLMLVAGQTAGQASAAANAALASEESAIWAPPATLATIATEGEASAQAPALMAAALAEGQGLAFAAQGGLITGPTLTMMGEAGPEFVMRNEALAHYGANFMRDLNARRFPNAPSAAGAAAGYGVRPSGATSTGINVEGHQVSIAMLRDHSEIKQFLSSAEGEAHVVRIARKNRYKIGVPT
jgi:hypothetical protein